jgi:hypothetical protein
MLKYLLKIYTRYLLEKLLELLDFFGSVDSFTLSLTPVVVTVSDSSILPFFKLNNDLKIKITELYCLFELDFLKPF